MNLYGQFDLGVSKKIKKLIKSRKLEKKQPKKPNREKKLNKPIRILKKPIGLVRFYKLETEKTKPNPNRKKPSQNRKTEPNRFEPVFF